jgi:hypothetical protein
VVQIVPWLSGPVFSRVAKGQGQKYLVDDMYKNFIELCSNEVVVDLDATSDDIGDLDQGDLSRDFSDLTESELRRLKPGGWLNDTLINLMIR